MRKLQSIVAGLVLLGTTSCSSEDVISISGEIHNPGNVKVVAFYEGDRKLDSVFLSDQNKFKFERPATQPRLLSIQVGNNKYPIILSPGENVSFSSDLQNDPEKYVIDGSDLSKALQDFAPIKQRKDFLEDSLQTDFIKNTEKKSDVEIENLRTEYLVKYRELSKSYTKQSTEYADEQQNLAGFYAMSTLDAEVAESELINYADQIKDDFLDNGTVIQFKEEIDKLRKLAIGQPAPMFEGYTPNNKTVKLSDYKGKYTLVDFWASWCQPCRKENPNLLRIYNQYKDKNFTILGVSLDSNPGLWMGAIEDDKLPWVNVSDLKAWSSTLVIDYRIKGLPASVLLDPEGKIIAKNLRSSELEEFLKKTLN